MNKTPADSPLESLENDSPLFLNGALVWLLLFFIAYLTVPLTNNREIDRWYIVPEIPFLLLDLVDPLPEENPHPAGWAYFPQRIPLIGVAATVLLGGWGLGQLVTRLIRIPLPPFSAERTVFAAGLGISFVTLLTLGGGLLGILSQGLCYAVLILTAIAGIASALLETKQKTGSLVALKLSLPESITFDTLFRVGCCLLMCPFVLSMFLGSMLPSTDYDVLEYHFGGPKEYYLQGYIGFLPHNVYTSFPFLTEMVTLLSMTLKGDWFTGAQAGKLVLMSFALFTALGIFTTARHWFSSTAGWIAATVFLTNPWTYRMSIIAYTEGALSFYLLASLLSLILTIAVLQKWKANADDATDDSTAKTSRLPGELWSFTLLTGLLSGSAMASKYPGVLSVVIPLGLTLLGFSWYLLREDKALCWSTTLKLGVLFAAGTLITIGPWLLKNLVETGNPVYPLLYSVFGGYDLTEALNAKWKNGHGMRPIGLEEFKNSLLDVTMTSDWISPLLFCLAPLAFLNRQHRRLMYWLWIYIGFLFFSWWFLTHRIDRFWVPMLPVVAVLAGIGATWSSKLLWRTGMTAAVLFAVLFNLCIVTSGLGGNNAYLDDFAYARKFTGNLTAPEIEALNQMQLGPDQVVLFVGEAKVFNAEFPVIYNTVFDEDIFQQWTAQPAHEVPDKELSMKPAREIAEKLKAEHIAYVYVNWAEVLRYRLPGSYGYTDYVTPKRFQQLVQEGVLQSPLPNEYSYQKFESLPDNKRKEIEQWAPELIVERDGVRYFVTAQIFPVAKSQEDRE
jgi:4-amino-4-deoxy-L-arabinose transferase-like glycosyltransferase